MFEADTALWAPQMAGSRINRSASIAGSLQAEWSIGASLQGSNYWIWPGRTGGLGSSLSDHSGRLYLLVRSLPGCLTVPTRCQLSKDAELLVLRHQNAVLCRQISRVCHEPGDRL